MCAEDIFKKDQLIPVIIQDVVTKDVLMLGYMNQEAHDVTLATKKVTFFSRSKNRLWTKGETSGNFLNFVSIKYDCDSDTILIKASPQGPVCHTGTKTCFGDLEQVEEHFNLINLENKIQTRISEKTSSSYVSSLYEQGLNRIAQKVGEEAIEVVIAAMDGNKVLPVNDQLKKDFLNECADLVFHLLILLKAKNTNLQNVIDILAERNK
jgi:phosphoribosyl-AMP cyclohydrolase / phosphoribosyl-ATP pyrophosphohydrolase